MAEVEVEQQLNDYIDASINPLKFFEHVKILDATTNQIIQYQMWPHLIKLIKAIYTHPLVIVLKRKQIGVSVTLAGVALHWCYKTGSNVIEISKGEDQAIQLLDKSRFIHSQLPKNLQLEKEHDGAFLISFKKKHSRIHTLPSTEDAGLGETGSLVIWDENEFHPFARENWAHLKPTIDAGAHGIVVSTADPTKVDSQFKAIWRGAREGTNNFYPLFLGFPSRPDQDDEWYEHSKRDYPLEWQFLADYPRTEEEALSPLTGRSVFDKQILVKMKDAAEAPLELRQGAINIYVRPKIGTHYIAGVDMAEGRGGDYSVLWIEGQEGLQRELCAVIYSNHINPDVFAFMSYELLKEYFSPMVIGGADAYGTTYLQYLIDLGYPKSKIYYSDKKKEKPGYQETGNTQQKDIIALETAIRGGLKIRFKPAILEMFAYQYKDIKGVSRAEPAAGAHNDLIMAMAKANFGFKEFGFFGEIKPMTLTGEKTRRTYERT